MEPAELSQHSEVVSGFCDRRKKQAIRERFDRLALELEYWQRKILL